MLTKFISLILLLASCAELNAARRNPIYTYRYEPTFILAKDGVDTFINYVRKDTQWINNFPTILTDIEDCAEKNHMHFSTKFKEIKNNLHKRIQRIIAVQGKEIYQEDINTGIGYLCLALMALFILFLTYKKPYRNKQKEMESLITQLSYDDIHVRVTKVVNAVVGDNTLIISPEHETMIKRVIRLKRITDGLWFVLLMLFFAACVPAYISYTHLQLGLNPHFDDQYLITYEILLKKAQSYSQ
jgi:hypothetical protein